jgi:hypothetical protein
MLEAVEQIVLDMDPRTNIEMYPVSQTYVPEREGVTSKLLEGIAA